MSDLYPPKGIAVIGMGCRFPRADDPQAFWEMLARGENAIENLPEERRREHALFDMPPVLGSFLQDVYLFDHNYFHLSGEEALYMDPQQRIMLELAVETMESASYRTLKDQRVGVFIGANQMAYTETITSQWYYGKVVEHLRQLPAFARLPAAQREGLLRDLTQLKEHPPLPSSALVGNLVNMIAGRISHELNLKGPSLSVDTACSSSLVAVHWACESLHRGECDLAFAGGINLNLTPSIFRYMEAAGVISPSGKCIPFSRLSDGILLGEGGGMVLLKRLEDAVADQDAIYAVIRGSGINNDGRSLSAMAPAWKGQLALLQATYERANYDPARITALEAHGTSTRIGDGVELSVIERFFPRRDRPLVVGSVKSNIGHTLGAAGIAGFLKMVLAIHHRRLPPSLHEEPDPKWKLAEKGIHIPSTLEEWPGLRAAGVSSFGFGGTNAHVILEEPPVTPGPLPVPQTVFTRHYFRFDPFPPLSAADELLWSLTWRSEAEENRETEPAFHPSHWLLFCEEESMRNRLTKELSARGSAVFEIQQDARIPASFTRSGEYAFCIDAANPAHYRWLLAGLGVVERLGILFVGEPEADGLADPAPLIRRQLSGLRYLLQAVEGAHVETRIWVLTFGAFGVRPGERSLAGQRALAALAAGALGENEKWRGGLLDLAVDAPDPWSEVGVSLGVTASEPAVIRENRRFRPVFEKAWRTASAIRPVSIRPGGVYLVIGGSAGVGAHIALHLLKRSGGKVVVSGSRKKEEVTGALQLHIASGAIDYIQSSALREAEMRSLIDTVFTRYGKIDGIVYAAGKIAYGSLLKRAQETFEEVLLTKMAGVFYLQKAIAGRSPDFVYLLGSVSGLSPAWSKGFAEYGAANAYLEAMAARLSSEHTVWMTGSWSRWENTGMAAAINGVETGPPAALSVSAALTAFDAALRLGLPHTVMLAPDDAAQFSFAYPARLDAVGTSASPTRRQFAPAKTGDGPVRHAGPVGKTAVVPAPDYKSFILQLLVQATDLPPEEIDETASFYQLGLDSLDAIDLVKKIEERVGMALATTLLFEHDSVEALAGYLRQLEAQEGSRVPETDAGDSSCEEETPFPLLPAQQTFYVSQRFYPDSPCNMLVRLDFLENLALETLQAAWREVTGKHLALSLGFQMTDEGPVQRRHSLPVLSIEHYTLAGREENAGQVQAMEEAFTNHLFSLEEPPLYRLAYLDFVEGGSTVLFVVHHIIADAWSVQVLLEEWLSLYAGLLKGAPLPAAAPLLSFDRYVAIWNDRFNQEDRSAAIAYWREALKNMPSTLALPYLQGGEEGGPADRYQSVFWEADSITTNRLKQVAKAWNATLFQVLLGAYYVLLHRLTQQGDLIVRVAMANREAPAPGIESLAGCLADSLPLRVQVCPGDHLEAVVEKVKRSWREAQKHTGVSAADIAALSADRLAGGPAGISPAGISFLPFRHSSKQTEPFFSAVRCRSALTFTDLSLICFPAGGQLACSWNFSVRKFSRETMRNISERYGGILASADVTAAPDGPPLVMPTVRLFPETQLLHEKVWLACRQYAGRTALVEGVQEITYEALQIEANRVANTLIAAVAPEQKIAGILAYPGAHAVFGILGILASGRTFIPFDPDWPDARIANMIQHSGLQVLLTNRAMYERLAANTGLLGSLETIVLLDGPAAKETPAGLRVLSCLDAPSEALLPVPEPPSPDDLAYVMYTSGTSGQPKGVMVRHRAVELFLNWVSETFSIDAEDRFIHTSSLGFGGSIRQIFSTLLAGATLYPIPRLELKDPQKLLAFMETHGITILNTVPTVLNNLLEWVALAEKERGQTLLSRLRLILVGGEALYAHTIARWRQWFGHTQAIYNLYGSTETIVNATYFLIDEETAAKGGVIPIGRQKAGNLVRLINGEGALCRAGETGELYVGGPCLSHGYFREEQLTAGRFVPLDHLGLPGIFYRTGDLARADDRGLFHYLGRNDDQIQVYGNRVELVEIEDVLYQTGHVKTAAVVDFQSDQHHWLVAFVALHREHAPATAEEIRTFVARQLPAYMTPHQVIILDKLPLNHAGKIDRNALRRQFQAEFKPAAQERAFSETEEKVAVVWRETLRRPSIGPEEDFFALGGDSILALEMLHKLRKHFAVVPPPVVLFRGRTIRKLAAELEKTNAQLTPEAGPQPAATPADLPVFGLSGAQKGFAALAKLAPEASPNWVALLPLRGPVDHAILQRALDCLLDRHAILRTEFVTQGLHTWQRLRAVDSFPVTYADLSERTQEEQNELLRKAFDSLKETVFDLSAFPLYRVEIYRTAPDRCVIAMGMHHIVGDAWSLHLLVNDLTEAYEQILVGRTPVLPPIRKDYRAVVEYQSAVEQSLSPEQLETQRTFWVQAISGLPALPLPDDNSPEAIGRPASAVLILPETAKERLLAVSRTYHTTLFNLLLALYTRALCRLYGVTEVLTGVAVNGRDLPIEDVQRIAGCFARNLPVRARIEPDIGTNLRGIEHAFLGALEHQDIPAREFLKIVSDGGRNSIFSIYRHFFSFMDFTALDDGVERSLAAGWDEAEYYFNAGAARTRLMVGALVFRQIRLQIHGRAPGVIKERLKALLREEVETLLSPLEGETAGNLDTALIAYLPGMTGLKNMLPAGWAEERWLQGWKEKAFTREEPRLLEWTSTGYGSSGLVFLPLDAEQMAALTREELLAQILSAIRLAVNQGARQISLAGVLPAMTNYGFNVLRAIPEAAGNPPSWTLTTGHSCTVVAVVKTVEKALQFRSLEIGRLQVAVVGFGSIGQAALRLLLSVLGKPAGVIVADLAAQIPLLAGPLAELRRRYAGPVSVVAVEGKTVPEAVYAADLIIGASSSGNIIEVDKLRPGTVLVDDSFPPIVPYGPAIRRMKETSDVLIVGGGKLHLGQAKRHLLAGGLPEDALEKLIRSVGAEGFPGCRAEPLLMRLDSSLPPTLGLVQPETALQYWQKATELGITAVELHLGGYLV